MRKSLRWFVYEHPVKRGDDPSENRSIAQCLRHAVAEGADGVRDGAAGGIGRSCAAAMAEAGANIIFADLPGHGGKAGGKCTAIGARYNAKRRS
jgi:hypothetical protein